MLYLGFNRTKIYKQAIIQAGSLKVVNELHFMCFIEPTHGLQFAYYSMLNNYVRGDVRREYGDELVL